MVQYDKFWELEVKLGTSGKYTHPTFVIVITSTILKDTERAFFYEDFTLRFNKVVKPFLASTGTIYPNIEDEMKSFVESEIEKKFAKMADNEKHIDNLDHLFMDGLTEDIVNQYYENICRNIKDNPDWFAVRGDTPLNPKDNDKEGSGNSIYDPKLHYGALITAKNYVDTYLKDIKDYVMYAVKVDQFKELTEMDKELFKVQDVVAKFVEAGYLLKGDSHTVEKDFTLSRANRVRCYVVKLPKPETKNEN